MIKRSSSISRSKNKHNCSHGVKKLGGCKKKPGRKPGSKNRSSKPNSKSRSSKPSRRRRSSKPRSSKRSRSRRSSKRRSSKRSRRRRSSKRRSSKRRSSKRSKKSVYMKLDCNAELKEKIKINTREYNNGKYSSRKQAIAVAYSQIKKKYPQCKEQL